MKKQSNKSYISVAICTYNGEMFIQKQIQSILKQSEPVNEIIICDDGSFDNTIKIAESILCDSGVKYKIQKNSSSLGITKNFEKCIDMCSGDIIFTADQDDIWRSDKVKFMLNEFIKDNKCIMCFSDARIIDECERELMPSLYKKDGFLQGSFSYKKYIDSVIRLGYTVYGCTMAFRKNFIKNIIPFFQSKSNHDAWIMCCAGFFGKVSYVSKQLISYRIHGANQVGSIAGNKNWEQIIAKQDEFDKYFCIQSLRTLRIHLISIALKQNSKVRNYYSRQCKLACYFYKVLLSLKNSNNFISAIKLLITCLNGSYQYRFCDRGKKLNMRVMIKQIPYDIAFLMRWKKEKC